jgi:hypothetical protein
VLLRLYALAHLVRTALYFLMFLGFWYTVGYCLSLAWRRLRAQPVARAPRMLAATAAASVSSL